MSIISSLYNRVIESIARFLSRPTQFSRPLSEYQLSVAQMFNPQTPSGQFEPLWVVQAPASEQMPIPIALLVRNEDEAMAVGDEMSQDYPEVFVFYGGRLMKTFRPNLQLQYIPGTPRA